MTAPMTYNVNKESISKIMSINGMMILSGIEWAMKKVYKLLISAQEACVSDDVDAKIQSTVVAHRIMGTISASLKKLVMVDGFITLTRTDHHDINNALAASFGNLELTCNAVFGDRSLITEDMLCTVIACTKTILQIIHVRMGLKEMVDEHATLDQVINIATEIARNSRKHLLNIVHTYIDINPSCNMIIKKNAAELTRVIMNLVCNALDATVIMRDYSVIWIDVRNQGNDVIIDVMDNGSGIPEEIMHKVFDENFTTKGQCGSGLGLHYCKRTIENKCGGHIAIAHNGRGTTVSVVIPSDQLIA